MAVTATMVKTLREKTGAGMMDCKKALAETNGDLEAAVDWLRKKGLSAASKKAGRVAAEGRVVAVAQGRRAALLEVNLETDFASRNEQFVLFSDTLAKLLLEKAPVDLEALQALPYPGTGRNVGEELTQQIATIGENMLIRRFKLAEVPEGRVATYIHMGGKIGVLVSLATPAGDDPALEELGKKLAMHVAAAAPQSLDRNDVPAEVLARERAILSEQAKASGKPQAIIDKMVEGRLGKFYAENCLVEQAFVMDPEQKVSQVVAAAAKAVGKPIQVVGFTRFVLGEGIEAKKQDFAQEVAQQLG
ncbi:MAG: elongation factor Ts [Magnetococcales bacterium]|nr:elongation factor Ts [Magnetococcales bacterium]